MAINSMWAQAPDGFFWCGIVVLEGKKPDSGVDVWAFLFKFSKIKQSDGDLYKKKNCGSPNEAQVSLAH